VTVTALSANDPTLLAEAFAYWEQLPTTCPATMVAGSAKEATIIATGVSWAIASFEPAASCVLPAMGAQPGSTITLDPENAEPFFGGQPVGVFERAPGKGWMMNEEGGSPFPCPAPGGAAPGPGNGALPASVVAAWGLQYAASCARIFYPLQPRGTPNGLGTPATTTSPVNHVVSNPTTSVPLAATGTAGSTVAATSTTVASTTSTTGPFGTTAQPISGGTPPVTPTSSCSGSVQNTTISILLTNAADGFTQPCYYIKANSTVTVSLTDQMTNTTTQLIDPMDFVIAPKTSPVVIVGNSGRPQVLLSNALYTSETVADTNTITFQMPPIPAGQYYLQLPALDTGATALLTAT
jgi:hypothetical protein